MSDSAIRRLTAAAVLLVAVIAAVVSFVHIQHLAVTHGQTALAAVLLPVSIDGTVAASSLVMLRAARSGVRTPVLARFGLALSVGATLAANITYGLGYGVVGALLSGWPGLAFVVTAEMAIGMLRRDRNSASSGRTYPPVGTVPSSAVDAAKASMRATVAAGNPLSVNSLQSKFSLSRSQATKLRREVLAESNGHAVEVASDAR